MHRFPVKFQGESNGNSVEALERCLDPELGDKGQKRANNRQISNLSLEKSYTTISE